jgi:hypothetical protein
MGMTAKLEQSAQKRMPITGIASCVAIENAIYYTINSYLI